MSEIVDEPKIDIVIVDAFSLLFRAFHSFPLSLTSPDGQLTNAVFGFTRLLLDLIKRVKPEYLIVGTDMGKPTFRHVEYTQYKANREEAPHELTGQIGHMKAILEALNIPTLGVEGYEADDVIGTLVETLRKDHPEKVIGIFTGDRDSFQLIQDNVFVLLPDKLNKGGLVYVDPEGVIARFGVRPDQVVDYKALCGDASDNIPGVRGIGPKSASMLLMKFDTLNRLYGMLGLATEELSDDDRVVLQPQLDSLTPSTIKKLADSVEDAFTSQRLARIDCAVPFEFTLEQAKLCDYNKELAHELFTFLGFNSLKKLLPSDTFEQQVELSVQGSLF